MKKIGRFIAVLLCVSILLSLTEGAFAATNIRSETFSTRKGAATVEVSNIENATYYLEVSDKSNISIAVYPDATIEYVVLNKNNPGVYQTATIKVSDMSAYQKTDFVAGRFDMSSKAIDKFTSIKTYFNNVKLQQVAISTVLNEKTEATAAGGKAMLTLDTDQTRALEAAKALNGQPFGPRWLGFITRSGVRADLNHFMSYASPVHTNTLLNAVLVTLAIFAGLAGISALTLMRVVTTLVISGIRYVQQGISLKRYDVTAMETKLATINGTTWYWAGKDTIVKAAVGDLGAVGYNRVAGVQHPDFNSHTLLMEKAINNYLGIW